MTNIATLGFSRSPLKLLIRGWYSSPFSFVASPIILCCFFRLNFKIQPGKAHCLPKTDTVRKSSGDCRVIYQRQYHMICCLRRDDGNNNHVIPLDEMQSGLYDPLSIINHYSPPPPHDIPILTCLVGGKHLTKPNGSNMREVIYWGR